MSPPRHPQLLPLQAVAAQPKPYMDSVEVRAGLVLLLATRRLLAVRRILTTLNVSRQVLSEG